MFNLLYDILYAMAFGPRFEFHFLVIVSLALFILRSGFLIFNIAAAWYNLTFAIIFASTLNTIFFSAPEDWTMGNGFGSYEAALLKAVIIAFWFMLYQFIMRFYPGEYFRRSEYKLFSLDMALAGALYFVDANNLMEMFIGLELMAFPTYTLIALEKTKQATEAALKYFVYSVLGALLFVLSSVVLFVYTGQFSFNEFMLFTHPFSMEFAVMLFSTAIMVKLGVGPFYHWTPQVYQTVSQTTFIFVSTVSKVPLLAAFIYLAKTSYFLPGSWTAYYVSFLLILGSFMAARDLLFENNFRRIMAYTSTINFSIGLLGYFMGTFNVKIFVIYTLLYLVSNLSVYIWQVSLNSDKMQKEEIFTLTVLRNEPAFSVFMTNVSLVMNSGLPPVTIFFFKLLAVGAIISTPVAIFDVFGFFVVFFILLISMSSYMAYFRIIKNINYREPEKLPDLYENPENNMAIQQFAVWSTILSIYIFVLALFFN